LVLVVDTSSQDCDADRTSLQSERMPVGRLSIAVLRRKIRFQYGTENGSRR
jgi:hypothetical protein